MATVGGSQASGVSVSSETRRETTAGRYTEPSDVVGASLSAWDGTTCES